MDNLFKPTLVADKTYCVSRKIDKSPLDKNASQLGQEFLDKNAKQFRQESLG